MWKEAFWQVIEEDSQVQWSLHFTSRSSCHCACWLTATVTGTRTGTGTGGCLTIPFLWKGYLRNAWKYFTKMFKRMKWWTLIICHHNAVKEKKRLWPCFTFVQKWWHWSWVFTLKLCCKECLCDGMFQTVCINIHIWNTVVQHKLTGLVDITYQVIVVVTEPSIRHYMSVDRHARKLQIDLCAEVYKWEVAIIHFLLWQVRVSAVHPDHYL